MQPPPAPPAPQTDNWNDVSHINGEVVPVGQRVRVKLVSVDVVHSFYVPQTLFKRQAIPGTENEFDLTFEKEGLYHGQCTQFCGLQHPDMVFRVRVVEQGAYQSWLAAATRRGSAGQPGT